MNDLKREPLPTGLPETIHMQADADGRGTIYQAGQSIIINTYGSDIRRAAVVVPLSPDAEGGAGVFLGRDQPLAALLAMLEPLRPAPTGTAVSVISGLAGVGKTALARRAASIALGRGWFTAAAFADLHGYDPDPQAPVVPAQLYSSMLRVLGVSADQIPASSGEQPAAYHQLLASMAGGGQRILLVLDNVSGPEQVSDLLPDAQIHRVLITSRHTLGELDNAGLLELETLPGDEAVAVLAEVLRQHDHADERISLCSQEAGELARLCGCLPLALRITGALLAEDRDLPPAELVRDLADAKTRLDGLVYGVRAVSAAFDLSWQHLRRRDEQAAQLFLWLPINPGPEISCQAAAALADRSELLTSRSLRVLRRGHLIEPGTSAGRWRMHDLLRLYADRLGQGQPSADYQAAVSRLLRYYLDTTGAANQVPDLPGQQGPGLFADRGDALAWLDAERPNLTGAVLPAAGAGYQELAADLALALSAFLRRRRHFDDYLVTATAAVWAAVRLRDPRREAKAVTNLGLAAPQGARLADRVLAEHERDAQRCRESGDHEGEAQALVSLGAALWALGRFEEVIDVAEQACGVFRDLGGGQREAWALTSPGLALQRAGRTDEAIEAHEQAVATFQEIGDRYGEASSRTELGIALSEAGSIPDARHEWELAAGLFQGIGAGTDAERVRGMAAAADHWRHTGSGRR